MSCKVKKIVAVVVAVLFVIMEPAVFAGSEALAVLGGNVYAAVGSIADGEDITYDKNGGVLAKMGFDTSKLPDTYDPDATTNPYGSDVSTLDEVKEAVWFDTSLADDANPTSTVFGHKKDLNGEYDTFIDKPLKQSPKFLQKHDFYYAVKCDIDGNGRDSALAVVYTHYNGSSAADRNLYMCLYDPATGRNSDSFVISSFEENDETGGLFKLERFVYDYLIQSQMQITAGDYDKDSIDEIAVFAPAKGSKDRNKIMFFDLTEGKDCQDPYSINSWRQSWNFMLPLSKEDVILSSPQTMLLPFFAKNIYNNLDLASGDADNDGICDLIVSYGASDTNYNFELLQTPDIEQKIVRSLPSRSVLLYGSDSGQMLRDSQAISYGGENLIRVSFAFGDIDGDGNEDMFLAGQSQEEQGDNISRTIGKYVYDSDSGEMVPESMQNMKVVNGTWGDDGNGGKQFFTANGWDGYYHSAPLMKTNIAVGNIMGDSSDTKIYVDSVLYEYDDGSYQIADELEDPSPGTKGKPKGSCVFAGPNNAMMGYYGDPEKQSAYYEFGADVGNYMASVADYVLVNRVSINKHMTDPNIPNVEAQSSILLNDSDGNLIRKDPVRISTTLEPSHGRALDSEYVGAALFAVAADTDVDSMVATYTGEHNITYEEPDVLAVLASAPYFKDVAAYDDDAMLGSCSTEFTSVDGTTHGLEHSYESQLGVFVNAEVGSDAFHIIANVGTGWAREETWGWEEEREFEMTYETEGGEDAVVMYSIPTENYIYKVEGVTVNDDGEYKEFENTMTVSRKHNKVTQTLTLEDYMEIQEQYPDKLPDVTKYLASTPGDPSSYPKSESDIPKAAKANKDTSVTYPVDSGGKWCGLAYGDGSQTQTISYSKETRDRYQNHMDGGYGSIEVGVGTEERLLLIFNSLEGGISYEFSRMGGYTNSTIEGSEYAGTVANMPTGAKGYGYDFSWKLLKYSVKEKKCSFPVVTYIVDDIEEPPQLPEKIEQDFDNTTDSQIALTWTYNHGNPQAFEIYRYEDFPIGGGDKLIGTVGGSEYRVMKDDDGNTLKDKDGHIVKGYTFVDTDLSADTKYRYRMKVRTQKLPGESIFSPVIEGRTFVSEAPDLSLSTDDLTIYPDSTYDIKVKLADPENYQKEISYQWQKYNTKKRTWEDQKGLDKQILHFYNCDDDDEGLYRCRVNLIRKRESSPQYISAFTEACQVEYSMRKVEFGKIQVFDGQGSSDTNTGFSVSVYNADPASIEKPTGKVTFSIDGPNGNTTASCYIDEATGKATINSIEDLIGTIGQQSLVPGGYLVTASYEGSGIFYAAVDPEEYHYLRKIDECMFLSTRSTYYFGDDIMESSALYDYKKASDGKVRRTDFTDKITSIKFYKLDGSGQKAGEPVAEYDLSKTSGKAQVPFNKKLSRIAYVEACIDGSDDPAAHTIINTTKIPVELDITDTTTGTGPVLEFLSGKNVSASGGVDIDEKNIETDSGKKSLSDFMLYRYYEQNGDFICTSDDQNTHKDEFIPASYYATVEVRNVKGGDDASWFYKPTYKGGRFMVVGNYYMITAGPKDPSSGSVKMLSPDSYIDFEKKGYAGGVKIILKALPNTGYKVNKWIVDDCGKKTTTYEGTQQFSYTTRSENTTGDGEVVIKADMVPKDNKITYDKIGQGTVTVDPAIESGSTILADTRLKFMATPAEGWNFMEWRISNNGGDNIISGGTPAQGGTNTKTVIMPDNSCTVYGVFEKDTIDLAVGNDFDVTYINDGSNPYYDVGATVPTERGRNIPKGAVVTVSVKQGRQLAPGAQWKATATTTEGIAPLEVTDVLVQGRQGGRFTLPDNVTACQVEAATEKGKFSVEVAADDIEFQVLVDGAEMALDDNAVNGIESGAQVDITAKPTRGKVLSTWIVNGNEIKSKDLTYTFNIIQNMSVSATTEADEKVLITVNAEGGGTGSCVVTDKNGKEYENKFSGDTAAKIEAYKGEKVTFSASDDDTVHTLTSVFVDGEQQELADGEYTLAELAKDITVTCRFASSMYHDVTFSSSGRYGKRTILDEDGAEIANGGSIKAADRSKAKFSVRAGKRDSCVVFADGVQLKPYKKDDSNNSYTEYFYETDAVTKDMEVQVSDHAVWEITDEESLGQYFKALADSPDPNDQPDAVLMNDIKVSEGKQFSYPMYNYTSFDGKGHTISGLTYGSEGSRVSDFNGIFGIMMPSARITNLCLSDVKVYMNRSSVQSDGALLTWDSQGVISNVTICGDSLLDFAGMGHDDQVAAITFTNHGKVENCMVTGFKISSTSTIDDGSDKYKNKVGCAGVVQTQDPGMTRGNYFEDFKIHGSDYDSFMQAKRNIVAYAEGDNNDMYDGNYFKQDYVEKAKDENGTSVYALTANPDDEGKATAEVKTPEFIRKLAYLMNQASESQAWGTKGPDDASLKQIALSAEEENRKAPVKVDFTAGGMTVTQYLYPGKVKLPGTDEFGDKAPVAWLVGETAYAAGSTCEITQDMTVTDAGDVTEYTAWISGLQEAVYYRNIADAVKAAAAHTMTGSQTLMINKTCTLTGTDLAVDDTTTVIVSDNVELTVKDDVEITNAGNIFVNKGAIFNKYASMLNSGTLTIDPESKFVNYGSTLENTGTIKGKEYIICKPHILDKWTYEEKKDGSGTWIKSSTCKVCGKTVTEEIQPDPPVSSIESIEILSKPDTTIYQVGEKFSSSGLKVSATLTDGAKASITKYDMLLDDGGQKTVIKDGDTLVSEGEQNIIVKYDTFTVSFAIQVLNIKDILSVTDADGQPVTEKELEPGKTLDLKASLKSKVPFKTSFKWESSDTKVAMLTKGDSGEENTVSAVGTGQADITVTLIDEKGNPVQTITPWTVKISSLIHITDLHILNKDIRLEKGNTGKLDLSVVPANSTDTVKWSSSDESIATVSESGGVTAVSGGNAVITAEAPNGIKDTCKVYVYEKARALVLEPEKVELKIEDFDVIVARVENANANGEIEWTVSDANVASFYVRNPKTGAMEFVGGTTTPLSADGSGTSDATVMLAGLAQGSATVTARVESESGEMIEKTCEVTVEPSDRAVHITHNGAYVSGETMRLALDGKYILLSAVSTDDDDRFIWTSIDDKTNPVINVDNNGNVMLLRPGTAAIRVTSEKTGEDDVCMIEVYIEPTGVVLSDKELELKKGASYQLTATLVPEEASGNVIWSSSDETVAIVEDGLITAKKAGETLIKCKPDAQGAKEATCKVTVYEEPVTVDIVEPPEFVRVGESVRLFAELTPKDVEGTVFWSSSDPSVLAMADDGTVTGLKIGKATVTALFDEEGSEPATCEITVYDPVLDVALSQTSYIYDGKTHIPTVTVTNGDTVLGADLTESNDEVILINGSASSILPGKYKIAAVAREWHYGSGEATYDIIVKTTKLKSVKKGSKKFTAKWKKLKKQNVSGYQLRWSTKKNMKSSKTKTIKKVTKNKITIKNLKGGKKYYVQVRTYLKKNGVKYYSSWSNKKKVKTKK